jgi:hypothetical protein
VAVTQSFFPEIRKQMLADSRRRQSREAVGGGIADLVSPRGLNLSPSQKKEDSHVGDFIVDEPFTIDSAGFLLDGEAKPLTPSGSSHRVKAAAVAMAEAGSAVEEVVTEEVRDLLIN